MARAPRGLRKILAPTPNKEPVVDAPSSAQQQLARFQAERGAVRRPPISHEKLSPEDQARVDEETAQRILAEAPAWAQQARIDPYNGQITHYIDIAGNATPPETRGRSGFSRTGYPRQVPEAYLPPGALDPKPKPKPGSGPPSVADDLVNQVDLSRLRIVKDLKHDEALTNAPASDQPAKPELGPATTRVSSAKELAEKSLAAKLGARGFADAGAVHSGPALDR